MMGYGFDPSLSEGSLKAPIFLTSTFVFEKAADGQALLRGHHRQAARRRHAEGLVYSRFNGPNQEILEDRLQIWEDAEAALTFSSGMTAIATLLLAFVRPGDVIVHSGPLYAATETIIDKILPQFGMSICRLPGRRDARGDWTRSWPRPRRRAASRSSISKARPTRPMPWSTSRRSTPPAPPPSTAKELPPIAIDNTFLGPLWAKPLAQGADISVYSLTKYAGGHSDLVAGGLVGSRAVIDKVRMMRNIMGGICDPNTAWMLLRSLETLELRMKRAGENAAKVCAFLRDHPKVESVGYLGFLEAGSRQADIYNRHCTGAGSTFSLYLKGGEKEAFAFLDALQIAHLAVSLGGTETLAARRRP